MTILAFILVGIVSGWLAGEVMKGRGFGLFGNLGVGIIGALIGSWIFNVVGFSAYGFVANVGMAFLGSVVLLALTGLVKRDI